MCVKLKAASGENFWLGIQREASGFDLNFKVVKNCCTPMKKKREGEREISPKTSRDLRPKSSTNFLREKFIDWKKFSMVVAEINFWIKKL